jgi:colicin import membrane protein
MEASIGKAVKDTAERLNLESKNREELLKKEFTGEKNVLSTRIESLDKTVKEQNAQIAALTQFLEKANQKVQEIAVKALESASAQKSLSSLQQFLGEQMKKQSQEK